jgi:hypothetical protein
MKSQDKRQNIKSNFRPPKPIRLLPQPAFAPNFDWFKPEQPKTRPVVPAPTTKNLPKKLAKILRRMANGDTLRPLGLFRFVQGAWKLLCKIKSHLIHRLEEMKLIEYVVGWRVTALGRAAIGLKAIDTSPLVKAATKAAL